MENEIFEEPLRVPLYGLVKGLRRHLVHFREVRVQYDPMAANPEDAGFYTLDG